MRKTVFTIILLCTFSLWGENSDIVWKYTAVPAFDSSFESDSCIEDSVCIHPGEWHFNVYGENSNNTVLYSGNRDIYVNSSESDIAVPVARNENTVTTDGTIYGTLNISISTNNKSTEDESFVVEYGMAGENTGITRSIDSENMYLTDYVKSGYYWIRCSCYSGNSCTGGTATYAWVIAGEECNRELYINLNEGEKHIWVAVSSYESVTSNDSVQWEVSEQNISSPWNSVFACNNGIVACGSGIISYSEDGNTWEKTTGYSTSKRYTAGCFFDNKLFCCSYKGSIAYSEDGITWAENAIADESVSWKAIESGCGIIAVCGYKMQDGKMYPYAAFSCDSVNWNFIYAGEGFSLNSICNAGEFWVACGGSGHIVIFDSKGNISDSYEVGTSSWNDVCYGDGKCIVAGNSNIAKTEDFNTWKTITMPDVSIKACCFAGGKWVALSSYCILCSNDCFETYSSTEIQSSYVLKDIYAL